MWGVYARCQKCGIATYDLAGHTCDEAAVFRNDLEAFAAEFEPIPGPWMRLRWKPFEEWLPTPHGLFALYEARRPHGQV